MGILESMKKQGDPNERDFMIMTNKTISEQKKNPRGRRAAMQVVFKPKIMQQMTTSPTKILDRAVDRRNHEDKTRPSTILEKENTFPDKIVKESKKFAQNDSIVFERTSNKVNLKKITRMPNQNM
jgi:hypothetical protein